MVPPLAAGLWIESRSMGKNLFQHRDNLLRTVYPVVGLLGPLENVSVIFEQVSPRSLTSPFGRIRMNTHSKLSVAIPYTDVSGILARFLVSWIIAIDISTNSRIM